MPRRRVLTDGQLNSLLALPTTEPELLRHYTLSHADLDVIGRRRREHNRLGFALQLCALRYPGRLLRPGETIPLEVLRFVADQLGVEADAIADYAVRSPTRYEQLEALRGNFGFTTFSQPHRRQFLEWLLPVALATTSGAAVAEALLGDRLRSGDIWIEGSRQYRAIEDQLIARPLFDAMRTAGPLPLAGPVDVGAYLADRRSLMDRRLSEIADKASRDALDDMRTRQAR